MSRAFAPGRVNLIGEHTDYSGGLVLPFAIQLGVTVETRPGGVLPPLAQAVADELGVDVDVELEVTSDLPAGVGLASSAAFEVAVALALGAELEPLGLAEACRRAEERALGVPCGILDQAASVLGREGHAVLLDCGSLAYEYVPVPQEAAFVVLQSGVERRLAETGYAQRRSELEAGMPSRVRHVRSENERVHAFAEAIACGDLTECGRLMSASHASLRDDYEVSTPEVDALVEAAECAGALGARIMGGGFGGAVLALVGRADAGRFTAAFPESLLVKPSRGARLD